MHPVSLSLPQGLEPSRRKPKEDKKGTLFITTRPTSAASIPAPRIRPRAASVSAGDEKGTVFS